MSEQMFIDSSYIYDDNKRREYLQKHNYHLSFDMIDEIQKKIETNRRLTDEDYGKIIQVLYGYYSPFFQPPYKIEKGGLLYTLHNLNDQLRKSKGEKSKERRHKRIESLILEIELMKVKGLLEKMAQKFEQQGDYDLAVMCANELKYINDEFPSKTITVSPVPVQNRRTIPSTVNKALSKMVFNPVGCKQLYMILGRTDTPESVEAFGKGDREAFDLLSVKDIEGPVLHITFSDGLDVVIIDDKNRHPRMQVYDPKTNTLQLYKWYNNKVYTAAIIFNDDGSAKVVSGGHSELIPAEDVKQFIHNNDINRTIFNVDLRYPMKAVHMLSLSIKHGVRPADVEWLFNQKWSEDLISCIRQTAQKVGLPPEFIFSVLVQEGYPLFFDRINKRIRITKANFNTVGIDTYQDIGMDSFYDLIPELKKRGYLSDGWRQIPREKEKEYEKKYIPGVNALVAAERASYNPDLYVEPVDTEKYYTGRLANNFIQYNEAGDRWHKIYIKGLPNTVEALGAMLAYNRDKFLEYLRDRGFNISELNSNQICAGAYLFYNRGEKLAKKDLDKLNYDQIKRHLDRPYLTQAEYGTYKGKKAPKPVYNFYDRTAQWNTSRVLATAWMYKDQFISTQRPHFAFKQY